MICIGKTKCTSEKGLLELWMLSNELKMKHLDKTELLVLSLFHLPLTTVLQSENVK